MKSIVTGGAGFIGSNLVDKLLDIGHEVIVIDDESSDAHENFYWNEKTSNYKLNICDYDSIISLFDGVDYVFHLAAEARIQPTILNPVLAAKTNFLGLCTVLQASRESGVKRVMYSSTSSAYGLVNGSPQVETMQRDCLNPYSMTKCAGEDLCKLYYDMYGLETVSFRYFNVYGEGQPRRGQYAPVIGIFLRQLEEGTIPTVVGDGKQRRDFVHVGDVAEANILAMQSDNKDIFSGPINIGTGVNYDMHDLLKILKERDTLVEGTDFVYLPKREGEARITLADTTRCRDLFGWTPTDRLKEWLNG